ncbi:MAG: hypothetical protein LBI02_02495 [Opitutaceae bacterium]|jgi:hypothetical protein|nr:hypothetical protein [Opitutaceae bacterium]
MSENNDNPSHGFGDEPFSAPSMITRYQTAYKKADKLVRKGGRYKKAAPIVGIGLWMLALIAAAAAPKFMHIPLERVAVAWGIIGVVVWILIRAYGNKLEIQGQTFYATLDTAVNTSPLLDNLQKAEAMSIYKEGQKAL